MAWNQPGNNGQDRDPWGSGNQGNNSGGNRGRKQGPPDLDELLRKFSKKLNSLLTGNKQKSGGGNGNGGGVKPGFSLPGGKRLISIGLAAVVIVWVLSGFYTIKESERGVVTRFGKFSHQVDPGLNWKPTFIDSVTPVNVESVRELAASGLMLTADENVVQVEINVQYLVTNPENYLFNVLNPDNSLRQATDSALRGVIGKYPRQVILTEGRAIIRKDTRQELESTIKPYHMGLTVLDVNVQAARPPDAVKDAFDDAIAARENAQQYRLEAKAYASEAQPKANGEAERILAQARAYKVKTLQEAQGEVDSFSRILHEYKVAPQITRERLYIESMEKVLSHSSKVLISDTSKNLVVLPLDQLLKGKVPAPAATTTDNHGVSATPPITSMDSGAVTSTTTSTSTSSSASDDIMVQRRADAQRSNNRR